MPARFLRRLGRPTTIGPVGAAAMVLGHWLAYLLAAPRAGIRAALLASTGHAYWFVAVRVGLVCALAAVAGVVVRTTAERLRVGARQSSGPGATAVALAAVQVGGYSVLEIVERIVARAPLSSLFGHDVLFLGVLIQIGLAGLVALALSWLGHAARRLADVSVPAPLALTPRPVGTICVPTVVVRSTMLPSTGSSRGPPGLLVGTAR